MFCLIDKSTDHPRPLVNNYNRTDACIARWPDQVLSIAVRWTRKFIFETIVKSPTFELLFRVRLERGSIIRGRNDWRTSKISLVYSEVGRMIAGKQLGCVRDRLGHYLNKRYRLAFRVIYLCYLENLLYLSKQIIVSELFHWLTNKSNNFSSWFVFCIWINVFWNNLSNSFWFYYINTVTTKLILSKWKIYHSA